MTDTDHRDLRAASLWAVVAALATALPATSTVTLPIRLLAGVPLVFFLPGYAFLRAARLVAGPPEEWAVLAVGASIIATIAGGFVLHLCGLLTPFGWALWLAAITLICCAAAVLRQAPPPPVLAWPRISGFDRRLGTTLGLTAAVTAAAFFLIWGDRGHGQYDYTEFWMVPGPGRVTVGIQNEEDAPHSFDIEVALDGRTLAAWRGLALDAGESLTEEIVMPPPAGQPRKMEAWLFKDGDRSRVYRKVWLDLDNT